MESDLAHPEYKTHYHCAILFSTKMNFTIMITPQYGKSGGKADEFVITNK